MNDDEFINVGNNRCSSLNIVLKNEGILGGPHSAHEHFTLTWLFFKLSRLKKVESNVSVKPSHDVHLHSQYVPILPYSSRSYTQLADTIRDTGAFSWQESCKRSTNRKMALWAERVEACRSSGRTVKDWCKEKVNRENCHGAY